MSKQLKLVAVALAVLATPIAIVTAVWLWEGHVAFRGCDFGPADTGPGAQLLSANAVNRNGAPNSEGLPRSSQGERAARLYLSSNAQQRVVLDAFNDLTYVACSSDPKLRGARLWFGQFRSEELGPWLDSYVASYTQGVLATNSGTSFTPADGAGDELSAMRRSKTESLLMNIAIRYSNMLPYWIEPALLQQPVIVGWLNGDVLLATNSPDFYLVVGMQGGVTGPLQPDGRCQSVSDRGPMCKYGSDQ